MITLIDNEKDLLSVASVESLINLIKNTTYIDKTKRKARERWDMSWKIKNSDTKMFIVEVNSKQATVSLKKYLYDINVKGNYKEIAENDKYYVIIIKSG